MNVLEATKSAYMNSSHKVLKLHFPELELQVENNQIYGESLRLTERLVDGKRFELVGCISSLLEIQINGLVQDVKGKRIEVSITADETEEIPLFHGIVDSAKKQSNKNFKQIIAYDELYTKGNIDVAAWYNSLTFPISQRDFRYSLFAYIGLEQVERDLPNDSMTITKEYVPTTLQAISVIKAICQINGAFGIVNRYGKFEYRILTDFLADDGAYPGTTLYPPFYPGIGAVEGEAATEAKPISFYKKVDYEEYSVKPVEKVTIRQTDSEVGVTYGEGTNNYIIQGNFFTLNKSAEELTSIAQNIYGSIAGVEFVPFSAENSGYPYIEVGKDAVSYYAYDFEASQKARTEDIYTEKMFYVFKRTLSGIQALKDVYSVQGEEYQTEFITDVSTRVEQIKQSLSVEVNNQLASNISKYTYTKDEMAERYYTKQEVEELIKKALEEYWLSVDELPEGHENTNKWYVVQGETVVE